MNYEVKWSCHEVSGRNVSGIDGGFVSRSESNPPGLLPGGLLLCFHAVFQEPERLLWTAGTGNLEFLAALLVVGDEKLLHLVEERLADIADGFYILVVIRVNGNADEPVVAFGLSFFSLFGCDDADDAYVDEAANMRRGVHQNHNVERVAVLAESRGQEAEVEGEHNAFRQKP